MSEPRVWTVSVGKHGYGWTSDPAWNWGEQVRVVEAAPVAKLLERLLDHFFVPDYVRPRDSASARSARTDAESLLRLLKP